MSVKKIGKIRDLKLAPQSPHDPEGFPLSKIAIISGISNIPLYKNESFLRENYLEKRLSISQISRLTFSARSTVLKYLRDYGVPLRDQAEAHRLNKGQLRYGQKKINGTMAEHKRELENIAKMKELRSQGFSYWKIAGIFNSMGVPTKNKGSRWHPTTVMKILKVKL